MGSIRPDRCQLARTVKTEPVELDRAQNELAARLTMSTAGRNDEERRLTPEELEEFRELLLQKRRKLLGMSEANNVLPDESEFRLSDEVDLASAEYEAAFENRLRDREKFLLRKIDNALERITAGEYDECEDCGNYIAKGRLKARPETTLCIECKEEQEKREKMYQKRRNLRQSFEL